MLETMLGGALGFSLFSLTSHPNSPLNRRLPEKRVWRFHLTPEIKIRMRNTFLHCHHWLIFAGLFIFFQTTEKAFLQSDVIQGFMIGSIAQGLTYEDRFMVFYNAAQEKVPGKKMFAK